MAHLGTKRTDGERGQALVLLLGAVFVLVFGISVLGALGKALLGKGRYQRAADLAAVSAARSMRDDFARLFEPAFDDRRQPNPRHLEKSVYLARARSTALEIAALNGADAGAIEVTFPDRTSFAPLRVKVRLRGSVTVRPAGAPHERVGIRARAEAELTPPGAAGRDLTSRRRVVATPGASHIDRESRCAPTSRSRSTGWPRPLVATAFR